MLLSVIYAALGAGLLFLVYKGCVKVVDWRDND